MPEADTYFDAIDIARTQRVKELSEIKLMFTSITRADPLAVRSKAIVVLTYANWEGFYNDCVRIYLDFLRDKKMNVADASWALLVGALTPEFKRLRDRSHSAEAQRDFVLNLKKSIQCGFDDFDRSVVVSRSNLDFSRLSSNFILLDFDISSLQKFKIKIDKELVGWRHGVAHGNPPDLDAVNVGTHIELASELMMIVSGLFQEEILRRL